MLINGIVKIFEILLVDLDFQIWIFGFLVFQIIFLYIFFIYDEQVSGCLNMNKLKECFDMNSIEIYIFVLYRSFEILGFLRIFN